MEHERRRLPAERRSAGTVARARAAVLAVTAVAAAGLLSLVTGCAGTGGPEALVSTARATAQARAAVGDHAAAARTLERVVDETAGEMRDELLLEAAAQWFLAGERARALALVDQRVAPIPTRADPVTQLVAAERALASGRAAVALDRLAAVDRPYPDGLEADVHELTGRAELMAGNLAAGVAAFVERELWLGDATAVADNHDLLWQRLREAAPAPAPIVADTGDPVVDGWLRLAAIAGPGESNPARIRSALGTWQRRHDGHPANARIVPALQARYRALTVYPSRIALLLPLSGPLAPAAEAVRDGFVAAQLDAAAADVDTSLTVWDTQALGAAEAYAGAVADGADFIVGPLRKEAVLEISRNRSRRVPMLALNDPGREELPPGGGLYRFALSPEEEAAQAAVRAVSEGHEHLAALVPANGWGDRLLGGFREGMQDIEDAALVDYGYFPSSAADFSSPIRRLLRLDQSEGRYEEIRRATGTVMEFEPRRRADVDALLIAAPAPAARQLRPQLRFHFAADLPVYMTSAALAPQVEENRDLDGVIFADIPWLADAAHAGDPRWQALESYAPEGVRRARLYAFGADAFALVPAIWSGIGADMQVLLRGLTGTLRVEPDGRIARDLAFLTLRSGELVSLPALAPPEPTTPSPAGPVASLRGAPASDGR
jgi:outer membrane PBP1 activator LpoA protein